VSKKRPSGEQLRSLLNTPHFGETPRNASPPTLVTTPGTGELRLPISEIDPYDRNPRTSRNPEFEAIKESIRQRGIESPISVTCRPGSTRYMVAAGGNTRLLATRELYEETQEPRFSTIPAVIRAWQSESHALIGHLIENETRGDLSFIERARAVRAASELLNPEGQQPLSQRQLAETLKERGYRISHGLISQYEYTLDRLAEAIPQALAAGLGKHQVVRLRQLDAAARKTWERRQLGSPEMYEAIFAEALHQADDPDWNHDTARRELESAIAEKASTDLRKISAEIDAYLMDRDLEGEERVQFVQLLEDPPQDSRSTPVDARADASMEPVAPTHPHSPKPDSTIGGTAVEQHFPTQKQRDPGPPEAQPTPPASVNPGPSSAAILPMPSAASRQPVIGQPQPGTPDMWPWLKRLRLRCAEAAAVYAHHFNLDPLVLPIPSGYGFVMAEAPTRDQMVDWIERENPLDEAQRVARGVQYLHAWWHLFGCAHMPASGHLLSRFLPAGSWLRGSLDQDNGEKEVRDRLPLQYPFHAVVYGQLPLQVLDDMEALTERFQELYRWSFQHRIELRELDEPEERP